MAFVNSTFPELKMKHGLVKQVVDPVTITGNGAREVRRRQNQWERFVWSINSRTLSEANKLAVHTFLRSVNVAQDSFLYRDPTMPTLTDMPLSLHPGGAGDIRDLALTYGSPSSGQSWLERNKHPLFNVSLTGLTFKNNGTPTTATWFAMDNGMPVLQVAGASSGTAVTMSGTPKFVVRFNGTLSWAIAAMTLPNGGACGDVTPSVVELGDFQLVEVFEQ